MSTVEADLGGEFGVAVVTRARRTCCSRAARPSGRRVRRGHSPASGEKILVDVERLADLALRTLAVAYRPLPDGDRPQPDESLEDEDSSASVWSGSSTRRGPKRARRSRRLPEPASAC